MSILAYVLDPQNEEERKFSTPVASEAVFKARWQPIIEGRGLRWLPLFSTGVDIQEQDVADVINELKEFRSAYIEKYGIDEVINRVDVLLNGLPRPFAARRGVVVYVG